MVEVLKVASDSLLLRVDGVRKAFVGFVDGQAVLIEESGQSVRLSIQRFGELLAKSGASTA